MSNPFKFVEYATKSSVMPKCRTEPILHCDGKKLYSFSIHHYDVMEFNLETRVWRYMNDGSKLMFRFHTLLGVAFHGRNMIILTVMETLVDPRASWMHKFNLDDETMEVTPLKGEIPLTTSPTNFITHENYYYTVGATRNGKNFSDVYRLDTRSCKWECVYKCTGASNEPPGRQGHTLVYDGSKIYMFRATVGWEYLKPGSKTPDKFTEVPAFDLITRKWTKIDTFGDKNHKPRFPPKKRNNYALTQYTDQVSGDINIIISGGEMDYHVYKDVWRLNLRDKKWTCLEKFGTVLPTPVDYHSMFATPEGKLYLYGGFTDQNAQCSPIDCKSCSSKLHVAWVTVPKLEYLCWKALEHHHSDWAAKSRKQLYKLGPWVLGIIMLVVILSRLWN